MNGDTPSDEVLLEAVLVKAVLPTCEARSAVVDLVVRPRPRAALPRRPALHGGVHCHRQVTEARDVVDGPEVPRGRVLLRGGVTEAVGGEARGLGAVHLHGDLRAEQALLAGGADQFQAGADPP